MEPFQSSLRDQIKRVGADLESSTGPVTHAQLAAVLALLDRAVTALEPEESALRIRRLQENQRSLDARLVAVEQSRGLRFLRWAGERARIGIGRFLPLRPDPQQAYQLWIEHERAFEMTPEWYQLALGRLNAGPVFGLLLMVKADQSEPKQLRASIESLRAQSYPRWELWIAGSGTDLRSLERDLVVDTRVRLLDTAEPSGADAANRMIEMAGTDFFASLGPGDILAPHALFWLAQAVAASGAELVYSDEDMLDSSGCRVSPLFKPAWSPELLHSTLYPGHLLALSRDALARIGVFPDGPQEDPFHHAALRLAKREIRVRHVPRVLYHARSARPVSTIGPDHKLKGAPLASIIICSRQPRLLRRCLRSIQARTAYGKREIIVVQHQTDDSARLAAVCEKFGCRQVRYPAPFNFSRMNNLGTREARGEFLVFLNDDVEPTTADWLERLLAQAQRPEVGVVGALLRYPSGTIQHAGVAVGMLDGAGHPLRSYRGSDYWPYGLLTRNVSAVTGACMALRKSVFEECGGFDEGFPVNYNDVDLCLRVAKSAYQIICETRAVLVHREAGTRVPLTLFDERERFHARWHDLLAASDPFYHPNLTREREDASLGFGAPPSGPDLSGR